jgi:predicted Ser/Thr protein kinase
MKKNSNERNPHYYKMKGYDYIYVFSYGGNKHLIKFSSESPFKGNIVNEWKMYRKMYALDTHTFVLKGVEGGIFGEYAYIILPFVEGNTLRESLAHLSKKDIVEALLTVRDALELMFTHNICHGDMHWDNILLTDQGTKIIDFDKTGPCDGKMNVGQLSFKGRNTLRKNFNFIGLPHDKHNGFFLLCKTLFAYMKKPTDEIETIIDTYINSEHSKDDIQKAYTSLELVLKGDLHSKGGGRTRRRRSIPSSK